MFGGSYLQARRGSWRFFHLRRWSQAVWTAIHRGGTYGNHQHAPPPLYAKSPAVPRCTRGGFRADRAHPSYLLIACVRRNDASEERAFRDAPSLVFFFYVCFCGRNAREPPGFTCRPTVFFARGVLCFSARACRWGNFPFLLRPQNVGVNNVYMCSRTRLVVACVPVSVGAI